jgi:hypothetical protein
LIGILQFAVLDYYRAAFDLRNYIPTDESKTRFIEECEHVKQSAKPKSHKRAQKQQKSQVCKIWKLEQKKWFEIVYGGYQSVLYALQN